MSFAIFFERRWIDILSLLRQAKRVAKEEVFVALEFEAKLAAATLRMEESANESQGPVYIFSQLVASLLAASHLQ